MLSELRYFVPGSHFATHTNLLVPPFGSLQLQCRAPGSGPSRTCSMVGMQRERAAAGCTRLFAAEASAPKGHFPVCPPWKSKSISCFTSPGEAWSWWWWWWPFAGGISQGTEPAPEGCKAVAR